MIKEYFFVGLPILITAIIFNILLTKIGLPTWYDLITAKEVSKNYISLIILAIVYPTLLGYVAIKTLAYLR